MKIAAFAILLAQLSGGPFERLPLDPTVAAGVTPHGILFAWSDSAPGQSHYVIRTAVMDFDGNWISPIHTLAPLHNLHATTPAIATDGERFFVAWVYNDGPRFLSTLISGTLVNASGEQISETFDLGDAVTGSPSIVWDGLVFRSYGWHSFTITTHGAVQRTASAPVVGRVPFANPDANGWVDWKETRRTFCIGISFCAPGVFLYDFDWAIVSQSGIHTGAFADSGFNPGKPAVVAREDDLLVIWSDNRSLKALPIVNGEAGQVIRADATGPVTAPTAAESLVVFASSGDIWGLPIVDGPGFGKLFRITKTKEVDTVARVHLVGPNRYLVTWFASDDVGGTRRAGQFVSIP